LKAARAGVKDIKVDDVEEDLSGTDGPGTAAMSEENLSQKDSKTTPPLLYVDVNLGPSHTERIVVYEGDTAFTLAKNFSEKHGLNPAMIGKLTELLEQQMSSLLECIAEEEQTSG
jgi:hypothetical protein